MNTKQNQEKITVLASTIEERLRVTIKELTEQNERLLEQNSMLLANLKRAADGIVKTSEILNKIL